MHCTLRTDIAQADHLIKFISHVVKLMQSKKKKKSCFSLKRTSRVNINTNRVYVTLTPPITHTQTKKREKCANVHDKSMLSDIWLSVKLLLRMMTACLWGQALDGGHATPLERPHEAELRSADAGEMSSHLLRAVMSTWDSRRRSESFQQKSRTPSFQLTWPTDSWITTACENRDRGIMDCSENIMCIWNTCNWI